MKVVPQAGNCKEIEVGGRVYRRSRTGLFDMPESAARYTIALEGGQLPSLSGTTRSEFGFRCSSCGFGSFFSTCSRCGSTAVREGAEAPVKPGPVSGIRCRCPGGLHGHA